MSGRCLEARVHQTVDVIFMYLCISVNLCVYLYIYIYIYSFRTMYRLAHTLILLHILSNDRWVKRDDLCFSKVIKQLMDHRCITPLVSHVPAAHDVMDSP